MTLAQLIKPFLLSPLLMLAACTSAAPAAPPLPSPTAAATVALEPAIEPAQEAAPALSESDNLLAGAAEPVESDRDPDVPPLPFEDNADPALCGIPQPWVSSAPAYLSGIYEDELIQPIVYLYDSHLRRKIVGQAPHGTEIKILLSQSNPTLDYYLVKIVDADQPTEGWIPAPFVLFEPPPEL